MNLSKQFNVALEAIKKGIKAILDVYFQDFKVNLKEDHSVVTQADLNSDKIIRQTLMENFPDYGILDFRPLPQFEAFALGISHETGQCQYDGGCRKSVRFHHYNTVKLYLQSTKIIFLYTFAAYFKKRIKAVDL